MSFFRRSVKKAKPVEKSDSLGDLSEVMGKDYGHGFEETAEDPNVKPRMPPPPTVKEIGLTTVTLTWPAQRQAINKVVVQAMPAKKNPKASFKKFDIRVGGQAMTLTENAGLATEATIVGLTSGELYYFRVVVTNPKATVEGEITEEATKIEPPAKSATAKGLAKAIARSKTGTMSSSPQASPRSSPKASHIADISEEDVKAAEGAKKDDEKKKKEEEKKREEEEKKREKEEKKRKEEEKKEEEKRRKEEEKDEKKRKKSEDTGLKVDDKPAADSPDSQRKNLEDAASRSITSRLSAKPGVVISGESEFEKQERMRSQATKMFSDDKKKEVSKIYAALNPDKLYFESRREKEETSGEKWKVQIRGGGAGMAAEANRDYSFARNEDGDIIQEEEVEGGDLVEDNYDPKNVPDFGEFQEVMDKLRAERAEQLKQRQDRLRQEHLRKKEAEEAARQEELKRIKIVEDALKAKVDLTDADVKAAQARLEQETMGYFSAFSFKTS